MSEVRKWADVVLLDLRSANTNGNDETALQLMDEMYGASSHPPLVVLCDGENRSLLFTCIEHGASDSIANPPNILELRMMLGRARARKGAGGAGWKPRIVELCFSMRSETLVSACNRNSCGYFRREASSVWEAIKPLA